MQVYTFKKKEVGAYLCKWVRGGLVFCERFGRESAFTPNIRDDVIEKSYEYALATLWIGPKHLPFLSNTSLHLILTSVAIL